MRRVICPFCDPCGFFGALSSSTPFGSFQVVVTIRGAIERQPPRSPFGAEIRETQHIQAAGPALL